MIYSLEKVTSDDHDWLVELHNDPEVLKNLTHPDPITLKQHLEWWNRILDDEKQLRFIFKIDGVNTGFAKFYDVSNSNKNCVLGADIHKNFRQKGHAKHIWKLIIDHAFYSLNLHRVSLTTADYNNVAQQVYRKIGFKEEGRLIQSLYRDGKFFDQICMYMLKSDWEKP